MSAFSTTLSAFCAGNTNLPQLIAVLRDDLLRDREALFDDTTLIESAWRSGRVDPEVYRALRDTITGRGETPAAEARFGAEPWPEIRACHDDWREDPFDPITIDDPTLFRASAGSGAVRTGANGQSSSAPWSSPRSRPWTTDSPQWSDEPARDVSPGMVLKERFVLEEIIGRGGMGTVYKARDIRKEEAQDRDPFVAVKVLNEDFRRHPESFKALQREAKKSQSLAHPNVATVFDFDRDGAIVFLVMELLEGHSLQTLIQNRSGVGLPRTEVLRIVRSVGAALAHAHSKGVVHSDFKPANAIRTNAGAIKVLDFGIARAVARPSHTHAETTQFNVTGLGALTPAYASYEMLIGEPADPSDDVFALACVTYELFAGRHPFGHVSSLLAERRGLKPIPVQGLGRRSWRALSRGLAFSRGERTHSIEEFLDELAPKRRVGLLSGVAAASAIAAGFVGWTYLSALPDIDPAALWSRLKSADAAQSVAQTQTRAHPFPEAAAEESSATIGMDSATSQRRPTVDDQPGVDESARPQSIQDQLARDQPVRGQPIIASTSPSVVLSTSDPIPTTISTTSEETRSAPVQTSTEKAHVPAAPREFSIEQMKERLIAFSRMDEVPDAFTILRELEARLAPDDEFLRHDAPQAIGQAYSRLGERAFAEGNCSAAIALLDRAQEQAPDFPLFTARREQMQQVADLEQMLAESPHLSAEAIESRLIEIRATEGPQFAGIRSRLVTTLVQRIEALQKSQPAEANRLLDIGQEVFAGSSAMESLAPIDENVSALIGEEN